MVVDLSVNASRRPTLGIDDMLNLAYHFALFVAWIDGMFGITTYPQALVCYILCYILC